jgi:hypothetical protein
VDAAVLRLMLLERTRVRARAGVDAVEVVLDGVLVAVSFLTVPFVTGGLP